MIVTILNDLSLSAFSSWRSSSKRSLTGVKSLTVGITKEPVFLSMNFPLISVHKKRRTLLAFKGCLWKEKKKRLFFTNQNIADSVWGHQKLLPSKETLFLALSVHLFLFFNCKKNVNSRSAESFHSFLAYPGIDHLKNNNYSQLSFVEYILCARFFQSVLSCSAPHKSSWGIWHRIQKLIISHLQWKNLKQPLLTGRIGDFNIVVSHAKNWKEKNTLMVF